MKVAAMRGTATYMHLRTLSEETGSALASRVEILEVTRVLEIQLQ